MAIGNEVGTTVSLMLLISLGIASLIREYDLIEIGEHEIEVTWVPRFDLKIKHLGPFTVTHGLNHSIIMMAFSMAVNSYESGDVWTAFTSQNLGVPLSLALIIFVYSLFYPYLEVTEYQQIPSTPNSIFPASIQMHYLFTSVTLLLTLADEYITKTFEIPSPDLLIQLTHMILSIGILILIPFTILVYSGALNAEINNVIG